MTHDPPSSDHVKSYKEEITKAFDLTLPDGWFENDASLDVFNEALKYLCGYHYCGTGNNQSNKNLTLGSVYLIALTAMHEATKDISILTEGIGELGKYSHVFSRRFLLKQGGMVAEETARSLYFLFKNLFSSKQQNALPNAKKEKTKVDKFVIDSYGKKLKFTFNWSAHSEHDQNDSIEMQIRRLNKIELSDDYSKALTSLQNLWIYMLRSEKGFGNPGSVWMDTKTLYIASANSPFTVLIVCEDDTRYKKWADKLLSAGALEIFVLTNDSDVKVINKNSLKWPEDAILDDIPKELDCMLIHYSNRGFIKGRFKAGKTFSFNASGNPSAIDGGLKILRETSPWFDISSHEVKEIIEYCIEDIREIPSCCKQKKAEDYLAALTILCQGYLAVHAEHKEPNKDWKDQDIAIALEQMDWNSVNKSLIPPSFGKKESIEKVRNPGWWWAAFEDDFKNKDKKSLPVAIQEEWDASSDKEISKELEDLIKLIVADNEIKPPEMVAKAYLALVEKLGV